MCTDSLTNLHTLHRFLVAVAYYFTAGDGSAVKERNVATTARINLRHGEAIIFGESAFGSQVVANVKFLDFTAYCSGGVASLEFNASHRRVLWREVDAVEVKIMTCSSQVLYLEALHLYSLHEAFFVGIVSVERIYSVVLGFVRSRVVERKQRIELFECSLRGFAFHFLRLVHNDDWAVGGNHVNRAARSKLVAL